MGLNLDAIGKKIGPITKTYTWKDTVLYALGVGAGFSDLDYCYEKDLKVIPSFAITTIYDLMPEMATVSNVNLAGILHGEHEIIFHNPNPSEGTLSTEGSITRYYDKGKDKGALIIAEFETHHSDCLRALPPFLRAWTADLAVTTRLTNKFIFRIGSRMWWWKPRLQSISR
jgi:hypothetical protein